MGGVLTSDRLVAVGVRHQRHRGAVDHRGRVLVHATRSRCGPAPRSGLAGALLVASGSFSLVFGLSEGATYGWWKPVKDFAVGRRDSVAPIPRRFDHSVGLPRRGVVVRRLRRGGATHRAGRTQDPLFEFGQLRHLGFRYGLLTTMVLAMGQFGLLFVLPVLLQDGKHLSAWETGLWMVPQGVVMAMAAPIGGRLTRPVQHHRHRARRARARSRRPLHLRDRGVARCVVPVAAPRSGAVRRRRRLRQLAADKRDLVRRRRRQDGRRGRYQHDRASGGAGAGHRRVRVVHPRAHDPARDIVAPSRVTSGAGEVRGIHGNARRGRQLRPTSRHQPASTCRRCGTSSSRQSRRAPSRPALRGRGRHDRYRVCRSSFRG